MVDTRKPKELDPESQLADLERRLAAQPAPTAVLVRGEERHFRDRARACVIAWAKVRGLEIAQHDGSDPDFDARGVIDDLRAAPMFASARCIVVRGAQAILKRADIDSEGFVRTVKAFLDRGADGGMLHFEADGLAHNHGLVKACGEHGLALNLRKLYDSPPPWDPDPRKSEIVLWVLERARRQNVALTPDRAAVLVARTGNDPAALSGVLEQARTGGIRDVARLGGTMSTVSPFQVAEDLCRGDVESSVAGIEALFSRGFQERDGSRELDLDAILAVLFAALRAKVRQGLAGSRVLARGGDIRAAAEQALVPNYPRARQEFEVRVRARDERSWRQLHEAVGRLERSSRRNSVVDENEFLALALASARRGTQGSTRSSPAGVTGQRRPG